MFYIYYKVLLTLLAYRNLRRLDNTKTTKMGIYEIKKNKDSLQNIFQSDAKVEYFNCQTQIFMILLLALISKYINIR